MSKITFNDYYQYYLSRHQNRNCRRMHFLGQLATLIFVILMVINQTWWYLLLTPLIVYPFAIPGHHFEKEAPAFADNPFNIPVWKRLWYSKLSDFKMIYGMLTGKLRF